MKAIVIYDSNYGNTKTIANRVGAAIGGTVVHVGTVNADTLVDFDVVVVVSPTVGGRPTKAIQDFLQTIPEETSQRLKIAAFDTRLPEKFDQTVSFAAPMIAQALQEKGSTVAAEPQGFIVDKADGALVPGEADRAWAWARTIRTPI